MAPTWFKVLFIIFTAMVSINAATVTGVVKDSAAGTAIKTAMVSLRRAGAATAYVKIATDANGAYSLSLPADSIGSWDLRARDTLAVYTTKDSTITVAASDAKTIDLLMARIVKVNLTGMVEQENSSGTPVPKAVITLRQGIGTPVIKADTCDSATGNYAIDSIIAGKYYVTVTADGYVEIGDTIDLTSSTTKTFDLAPIVYVSFSGMVEVENSSGTPVHKAVISMMRKVPGGSIITYITADSITGNFKIDSIQAAKYYVTVTAKGYATIADTIDLSSSMTKTFDLRLLVYVSLTGMVEEENSSGTAVSKAAIMLWTEGITWTKTVYSDSATGNYTIDSIPSGKCFVKITAKGYVEKRDTFELNSSMAKTFDLTVMRYSTLSGIITDTTGGTALANAIVTLLQGATVVKKDTTGADGKFQFDSVGTGTYTLKAASTAFPQGRTIAVVFSGDAPQTQDISFKAAGIDFSVKCARLPATPAISLVANKTLRLNNFLEAGEVQLYDMSGRKIDTRSFPSGMARMDVPLSGRVASGRYIVSVTQKKSIFSCRIVMAGQ